MWVLVNLHPNTADMCSLIGMMPDERALAEHFNVASFSHETLVVLCFYKMLMLRILELIERQVTYLVLVYFAGNHYRSYRNTRI